MKKIYQIARKCFIYLIAMSWTIPVQYIQCSPSETYNAYDHVPSSLSSGLLISRVMYLTCESLWSMN